MGSPLHMASWALPGAWEAVSLGLPGVGRGGGRPPFGIGTATSRDFTSSTPWLAMLATPLVARAAIPTDERIK
ncbi:hypothetical protein D3C80_1689100 [compost metagenome]